MSLIDIAQQALAGLNFQGRRVKDFPIVNVTVQTPNGLLDLIIHAHDDQQRLLLYVRMPELAIHDEHLPAVMEFITRANYGLPLGNFELDMNDGELNFKNSIDVSGGTLSPAMAQMLITFAIEAVNRYLPGLKGVLEGEHPKAALEAIDGPTRVVIQ